MVELWQSQGRYYHYCIAKTLKLFAKVYILIGKTGTKTQVLSLVVHFCYLYDVPSLSPYDVLNDSF